MNPPVQYIGFEQIPNPEIYNRNQLHIRSAHNRYNGSNNNHLLHTIQIMLCMGYVQIQVLGRIEILVKKFRENLGKNLNFGEKPKLGGN